jgi:coenzyme F420-reducing hydrogenase delta subunit
LKTALEFIWVEPGRVQFSWVSAGEGEKFAQVVARVTDDVRKLGPAKRLVKAAEAGRAGATLQQSRGGGE